MSGYLQRLAVRSGLVSTKVPVKTSVALKRSVDVSTAHPVLAPASTSKTFDASVAEGKTEAPVSRPSPDEPMVPEGAIEETQEIRPFEDIRRYQPASPVNIETTDESIGLQDSLSEQHPAHTTPLKNQTPVVVEGGELINPEVEGEYQNSKTKKNTPSFKAEIISEVLQSHRPVVKGGAPIQVSQGIFTAESIRQSTFKQPVGSQSEPVQPIPDTSPATVLATYQAATTANGTEERVELDGTRRRQVASGRVKWRLQADSDAVAKQAGENINVRIGRVTLDVHQPTPTILNPSPTPASNSARSDASKLHRHYLKGW